MALSLPSDYTGGKLTVITYFPPDYEMNPSPAFPTLGNTDMLAAPLVAANRCTRRNTDGIRHVRPASRHHFSFLARETGNRIIRYCYCFFFILLLFSQSGLDIASWCVQRPYEPV